MKFQIKPEEGIAYGLIGLGLLFALIQHPLVAIVAGVALLFKDKVKDHFTK
jgi:hydrogenase/urease accessory protein HupE